jgi:hypothetical protein
MVFNLFDFALGACGLAAILGLVWLAYRGDSARDDEDAARAYFDTHGRWPDDPAP